MVSVEENYYLDHQKKSPNDGRVLEPSYEYLPQLQPLQVDSTIGSFQDSQHQQHHPQLQTFLPPNEMELYHIVPPAPEFPSHLQVQQPMFTPVVSPYDNAQMVTPMMFSQMLSDSDQLELMAAQSGFPTMDTFVPLGMPPGMIHSQTTAQQQQQQQQQRMRFSSESNLLAPQSVQLNQQPHDQYYHQQLLGLPQDSLSPDATILDSTTPHTLASKTTGLTYTSSKDSPYNRTNSSNRFRMFRGVSSGGSAAKPPKVQTKQNYHCTPVSLEILNASTDDICLPRWNKDESKDRRRIVRIERRQVGPRLIIKFSIVGSAAENPTSDDHAVDFDSIEVSCLECFIRPGDDVDYDETQGSSSDSNYTYAETHSSQQKQRAFYITSVEVIRIVEMLIGAEDQEPMERRRERGRIRSNLVAHWSKKPIRSRMSNGTKLEQTRHTPLPPNATDFRLELATRIMAYETRKPRGFDKEVRILKWEKLDGAIRRALQSYYVEIPNDYRETED